MVLAMRSELLSYGFLPMLPIVAPHSLLYGVWFLEVVVLAAGGEGVVAVVLGVEPENFGRHAVAFAWRWLGVGGCRIGRG